MVTQMMSTFVVRFIVLGGLMNHLAKPFMHLFVKGGLGQHSTSYIEFQAVKERATSSEMTTNYLDVLLPMCFVIFFGAIFPFCILLFVVLVLVQARCDAFTLTHVFQRPFPKLREAANLIQFRLFLETCGHVMIITKLALLFFEFGGVVQLDPDVVARLAGLPLQACNDTATNATASSEHMAAVWWQSEMDACRFAKLVMNTLIFLLLAFLLVALWHLIGFWMPSESRFTRIECYRHDLQRHRLLTTNRLLLPELQVCEEKLEGPDTHADFSILKNWGKEQTVLQATDCR